MKSLVLSALLIAVLGVVSIYAVRARADAIETSQRLAYAAMSSPRFPGGCPPVVRTATLDLCTF